MIRKIIVKRNETKLTVALLEDDVLVELFCEDENKISQGTVIKGVVENLVPSLNAAFINIGDELSGYLPLSEDMRLRQGMGVTVQIKKEKYNSKGAFLSKKLNISGKYAVLMEGESKPGVSMRITNESERKRLYKIACENSDDRCSVLIRTLAEEKPDEEIVEEISDLRDKLAEINYRSVIEKPVSVLYKESDIVEHVVKNYFDPDKDMIITNHFETYEEFYQRYKKTKDIQNRIKHYNENYDIFDFYELTGEIKKAGYKKVWLPCGGYLVFDYTEAMSVVDVNTGKNSSNDDFGETALDTNLEAAIEIARQIRLRNTGGIIVIDFVDMRNKEDYQKVEETFKKSIYHDRKNIVVGGFTKLGLFELTRQKDGRTIKGCSEDE